MHILFKFFFSQCYRNKFEKVIDNLEKPWSLSFINQNDIILTEKAGKLYFLNLQNKNINRIEHNLSVLETGQGGLLDVLYHDDYVYISFGENRGKGKQAPL